jgi:hypothetical protein
METGDDDDNDEDNDNVGAKTTMTTMIAMAQWATGYDNNGYYDGGGGR